MRPPAVLLTLLLAAILAAPALAQSGGIEGAVSALRSSPVYVDPAADPKLSDRQASALRDRIETQRAGPMYVAVLPASALDEAGGDPAAVAERVANGIGARATYVVVTGRHVEAGGSVLGRGVEQELVDQAISARGPDLDGILTDLVDRVARAKREGPSGGAGGGGGGVSGGAILLGLLVLGGGAVALGRRSRRRREQQELADVKRVARDDLVALGSEIEALDLDVQMPSADPAAREDYGRAVAAYGRAN